MSPLTWPGLHSTDIVPHQGGVEGGVSHDPQHCSYPLQSPPTAVSEPAGRCPPASVSLKMKNGRSVQDAGTIWTWSQWVLNTVTGSELEIVRVIRIILI